MIEVYKILTNKYDSRVKTWKSSQIVLSPSFWVSRTTRYGGVSESEWVVYDDTVIFSNLPVYYAQSASVST